MKPFLLYSRYHEKRFNFFARSWNNNWELWEYRMASQTIWSRFSRFSKIKDIYFYGIEKWNNNEMKEICRKADDKEERNIALCTIFFIHPSRRSSIKHNLKTTACAHTFSLRFFSASPWQKNFSSRFKVLTEHQTTCHFCCSTRVRSHHSCHSFLLFLCLAWTIMNVILNLFARWHGLRHSVGAYSPKHRAYCCLHTQSCYFYQWGVWWVIRRDVSFRFHTVGSQRHFFQRARFRAGFVSGLR